MSRLLEDFEPMDPKHVKMYVCGPTVYSLQHIGNMRAAYVGDMIFRSLKYLGYDVTFVRNYTDVGHLVSDEDEGEDKMEKGSKKEGLTPLQLADKYIKQYESDTKHLGNEEPSVKVRATETIKEIIDMIQTLYDKGYAYITDEAVYFDTQKYIDDKEKKGFTAYNKLNRQKLEDNISGAGHGSAETEKKKHLHDFALWIFQYGEHISHAQHWPSPFKTEQNPEGDGFPGWHIECSAMSKKFLGDKIDIHVGGIEHIPTHHTNEIAQSEAANGESPFSKYWLHLEHLLVDGGKMSKSNGTGFAIKDLEAKGYSALDLRYFFLCAHYRSQQNFTWDALDASSRGLKKLKHRIRNILKDDDTNNEGKNKSKLDAKTNIENYKKQFDEYISNDFNTSGALSTVWDILNDDNISRKEQRDLILSFDDVLGLQFKNLSVEKFDELEDMEEYINKVKIKVEERNIFRKEKNFKKADEYRDEINKLLKETNFVLHDYPDGRSAIVPKQ